MSDYTGTSSYYKNRNLDTSFRNAIYSLNIAIETHFAGLLFDNDLNRIIYSSTDYSFRKRAQENTWNNANLPFINYYVDDIENNNDLQHFNHVANIEGIYIDELDRKLRITPIRVQYDMSFWCHTDYDLQFMTYEVLYDDSNETLIPYYLNIDGKQIKNYGTLGYNLQYKPQFDENDWLERNEIQGMKLDISVDTFLIKDNLDVALVETVIFDFLTAKTDLNFDDIEDTDWDDPSSSDNWSATERITSYFS